MACRSAPRSLENSQRGSDPPSRGASDSTKVAAVTGSHQRVAALSDGPARAPRLRQRPYNRQARKRVPSRDA